MQIKSNLVTLKSIVEEKYLFNVPIYQRLYVWEEEQVKTLLEDIIAAYGDKKELFYLGGVLTVENNLGNEDIKIYDLIDGQQRFTTLWMIAIIFVGELKGFIELDGTSRVTFAIRDDVNKHFKQLISGNERVINNLPANITDALAVIKTFYTRLEAEEQGKAENIASFIYEKVQLVFTEVPSKTDLNKLFEVINNRGIQLQHHEILKARLLDRISSKDRMKYSNLWDCCAVMDHYIEKTIKEITKIKVHQLFDADAAKEGIEKLANPKNILAEIDSQVKNNLKPKTLLDILDSDYNFVIEDVENLDEEVEYEYDEVRSILTFPMLLQHTLRIYLANSNSVDIPKISDKELLTLFSNYFLNNFKKEEHIKEFIELLWRVRYFFDKHVIKWVGPSENETHLIKKIEKSRSRGENGKYYYYLRRGEPTSKGEALLQSMLYHSQQITTHYWLTPYLKYLIEHNGEHSYEYLKYLDNHLLCGEKEDEPLVVRTRKFLENPYYKTKLSIKILDQELGTEFPHYWFYKLEYVLWEKYALSKDKRWKDFKLTAKNSVEHISPQTQKVTDTNTVSNKELNKFGNLALVSRSINSEYSNLPFNEKRQRFINKNREKLDSLKMDLIYENSTWNDQLAHKHMKDMIKVLNEYLGFE
ncbi:hypothetical protein CD30_17765 [Ureibacillus massiliensis 4400831 = CIP 108448 = CCUG 49529]|uniref:DUF262 domain-containing protein n=1 Tax=Ureibacillus massiliensis 4400831 = CIP 108448 = CCUG 49529 TaxID=1211035 RepID=A0A0A3JPV2_9BACL|nr:DUF262 domain-containing protein [Ureibacillus massiliensis]KGR89057.1 hypothetical protein CD30_17765 [Ureibacillus massiliensis 4400831 = CIP 108448 = CCUG 49529]